MMNTVEFDFRNPGAAFRGAPFWAWNTRMTPEHIDRILTALKEMGMGGAYLHSRTGLDNAYLGEEFMSLIRYAHSKAAELGMLTYLYDEDRWPSGAAGGLVTRDHAMRARFLVFSPKSPGELPSCGAASSSSAEAVLSGERELLARYAVTLADGELAGYRMLGEGEEAAEGERLWYAWVEVTGDHPWFNNQAYLDTLNPEAVNRFIQTTHEAYAREVGAFFGKDIPAIFTDEPQFTFKTRFAFPEQDIHRVLPYTGALEERHRSAFGVGLLPHLPELFWELPEGRVSVWRYRYHDQVAELFASAFADQIGAWCREHGIFLTGHMMFEGDLIGQTCALGEAMRSYRAFDVPGIDMLCDWRELNTAKQAQSAAHQFGRQGVMSEIYGVTGWHFDFRGHKLAGDWQAALGVTHRVPHLTWTSMAGEAKRDYPASIGPQSPWYAAYEPMETYFSRLGAVLTRGKPVVRIGVVHPVESYWLYWGPTSQSGEARRELEDRFTALTQWLLYGLCDFDFISEGLLRDMAPQPDADRFAVGEMAYDVVIVPGCRTLRRTTLERLAKFRDAGGAVLFLETAPSLIDAQSSDEAAALAVRCRVIPFARRAVLEALSPYRVLDIRGENGMRSGNLVYQMRREDERLWLFVAHAEHPANPDIPVRERWRIAVPGSFSLERFDAWSGEEMPEVALLEGEETRWEIDCHAHDAMLYRLTPCTERASATPEKKTGQSEGGVSARLPHRVPVTLEEPNLLVMDMAEYRLDGEDWQPREEILRVGNIVRERLGYPSLCEAAVQPWTLPEEPRYAHSLSLRFAVSARVPFEAKLAIELPEGCAIRWNGEPVSIQDEGYYVDPAFRVLPLPAGKAGGNVLEIEMPFGRRTDLENVFLLGAFGVTVSGAEAEIVSLPEALAFGDIVSQGLPFYGGNLVYHIPLEVEREAEAEIAMPFFRCPAMRVAVDGTDAGLVAFAPYTLPLGSLSPGAHRVDVTLYGNRANTFGALHLCDREERWLGPNAWRSTGTSWAYEYQLRETGVLKAPIISLR